MIKQKHLFTVVTLLLLSTGCLHDDTQSDCSVLPSANLRLNLAIGDLRDEKIATRSVSTMDECKIGNLTVLLFDAATGRYKEGGEIDIAQWLSGSNGDRQRTLTAPILPLEGDRIVVLANYTTEAGRILDGNSTVESINERYRIGANGMSGEVVFREADKEQLICRLYHATAKVRVELAPDLAEHSEEQLAALLKKGRCGIVNTLRDGSGLIYGSVSAEPIPFREDLSEENFFTQIRSASSFPAVATAVGEYPNATRAGLTTVDRNTFHPDRACVVVYAGEGDDCVYRLDFSRQSRTTGADQSAANEFLDIRRNTCYIFTITHVKSRGYSTLGEALANPGSNIEYTVTEEDARWKSITGNGQYAVKTDRDTCLVVAAEEPRELLRFAPQMPDADQKPGSDLPALVTTRRVRLVEADKTTTIPVSQLQLIREDGTPAAGNHLDFTGVKIPDEGYPLKYTTGAESVREQCYVEITYGNIRHYVPVGFATFSVKYDTSETGYEGGTIPVRIESYARFGDERKALAWTHASTALAAWAAVSDGGTEDAAEVVVQPQKAIVSNPHDEALRNAEPVKLINGSYDLSTNGGRAPMRTANCYIVNAPGVYSLPLVYGNAIDFEKYPTDGYNTSAYTSTATGEHVLQQFVDHLNNPITDPYIYNNKSITHYRALKVWEDAPNLVRSIALSADRRSIVFEVAKNSIRQGNAVICVEDTGRGIAWSWHIWVTDYKPGQEPLVRESYDPTAPFRDKTVTNFQDVQYTFMGANLGWCEENIEHYDARSCEITFTQRVTGETRTIAIRQLPRSVVQGPGNNPYYQFGRKDPILAGVWENGKAQDKYHYCGRGGSSDHFRGNGKVSIGTAIMNPHIIYNNGGSRRTWCDANATVPGKSMFNNLWDANNASIEANDHAVVKTIYDPSPVGYCMPPSNAFTGFTSSGEEANMEGEAKVKGYGSQFNSPYTSPDDFWANRGFLFYCNRMAGEGQYDSRGGVIFFPATGNRHFETGKLDNMNQLGFCRSANARDNDNGYGIAFHIWLVNPLPASTRAAGFPVRPVREK